MVKPQALSTPDEHRLLSVQTADADERWVVLNVRDAVRRWSRGAPNLGLLVAATSLSGRPLTLGWVRSRPHRHQPLLVTYSRADPDQRLFEEFNEVEQELLYTNRYRNRRSSQNLNGSHARNSNQSLSNERACMRQELKVDFKEVNWDYWILAPDSYNAYQCAGYCEYPMGEHQRPSNHAIIRSIMLAAGKSDITSACCVPTKMHPMKLLFFSQDHVVVLKEFQNMIVEECGCS